MGGGVVERGFRSLTIVCESCVSCALGAETLTTLGNPSSPQPPSSALRAEGGERTRGARLVKARSNKTPASTLFLELRAAGRRLFILPCSFMTGIGG